MAQSKTKTVEDEVPPWEQAPQDLAVVEKAAEVKAGLESEAQVTTGEVVTFGPAVQTFVEWLAEKAQYTEDDEFAVLERMIGEMLRSDTPDEVLRQKLPIHARDILGKNVLLTGYRIVEGEYDSDIPFYAALDVQFGQPPEPHVVTCGGKKLLAQLMVLDKLGEWPQVIVIKESDKPTRKGYRPLRLERPDTGIR